MQFNDYRLYRHHNWFSIVDRPQFVRFTSFIWINNYKSIVFFLFSNSKRMLLLCQSVQVRWYDSRKKKFKIATDDWEKARARIQTNLIDTLLFIWLNGHYCLLICNYVARIAICTLTRPLCCSHSYSRECDTLRIVCIFIQYLIDRSFSSPLHFTINWNNNKKSTTLTHIHGVYIFPAKQFVRTENYHKQFDTSCFHE